MPHKSFRNRSLKKLSFSPRALLIFALVFAAVGGYGVYRTFAATTCLVSNRTSWALAGTDCTVGHTITVTNQTWACSQPLSNYGPLPIKVISNSTISWNGNAVTLDNGCVGDSNSDTIDLVVEINGANGVTGGIGPQADSAKLRQGPGPQNIQVTGNFDCGSPGPGAHPDAWQFQVNDNRNIAIVNGKTGNYSAGTSTCQGAGGGPFWTSGGGIDILGGEYILCNHALNPGGASGTNRVIDAKFRTGRSEGTAGNLQGGDPNCIRTPDDPQYPNSFFPGDPCINTNQLTTFQNVTCERWNTSTDSWPTGPPPPPPPPPSTFYVAPNGVDTNPGSSSQPWRTVQKALNTLTADQTAIVRAGTYTEELVYDRGLTNWITIRGEPGAIVDGNSTHTLRVNSAGRFLRFMDLTILGAPIGSGGCIDLYGQDIEILENDISGCGDQGIYTDENSRRILIARNRIHDLGGSRTASGQSNGVYLQGYDHRVESNLVYNIDFGHGLQIYDFDVSPRVINNTVVNSAHSGITIGGTTNGVFVGNIVYDNGTEGIHRSSVASTGCSIHHNISFNNAGAEYDSGWPAGCFGSNNLTVDPGFANYATRQLWLASNSPAINASDPATFSNPAFDGVTRPQGPAPDIGAYEFSGTPQPPPPPPPAPTVTLTANPTSVTSGSASTLTWSSANASSCTASSNPTNTNWNGSKATSGSQSTGNLTTTTIFSLSCSGAGGSANGSATVTVTAATPPPPPPTPPTPPTPPPTPPTPPPTDPPSPTPPTVTFRAGDINKDGKVSVTDLSILLSRYGARGTNEADINRDSVVTINDLSILLSNYGKTD